MGLSLWVSLLNAKDGKSMELSINTDEVGLWISIQLMIKSINPSMIVCRVKSIDFL